MVLVIFIFGVIFGSFINALVWRTHAKLKWWGNERSICPKCKHLLSVKDLVPIFSWVALKGRCRYCKKPIASQYPIVELLTGLAFAVSYVFWPYDYSIYGCLAFITWLFIVVVFMSLTVIDLKWFLLPNGFVFTVIPASVLMAVFIALSKQSLGYLLGALIAGLLFFGLLYVLFAVSGGQWIGGGDVKLAFALGVLAGTPILAALSLFLASLIGTLAVLPALVNKKIKLKTKIPFGPLLIMACYIVVLWGQIIIDWYKSFLYL